MAAVTALLEAIEQRARSDADAVLPVLRVLADPDRPIDADADIVHAAAVRLNQTRVHAAEQAFRDGGLDTAEVREQLGVSRQAVAERLRSGRLLAAKVGSRWCYPGWQFTSTGLADGLGEVIAGLRVCLHTRVGDALDARAADAVMRAPQAGIPDRMSLADLLSLGETTEVIHRLLLRAEQS